MCDGDDVNAAASFIMPVDNMAREKLDAHLAGVPAEFSITSWNTASTGDGGVDLAEKALTQLPSAAFGDVQSRPVQLTLRFVVPGDRCHECTAALKLRQQLTGLAHDFHVWNAMARATTSGLDAAVDFGTPSGA
jgi:hypothetical protein